jgi:hypothetical protein
MTDWSGAEQEHDIEVGAFIAAIRETPADRWHHRTDPARWTAAELALHVIAAYELGEGVGRGEPGMALRLPRWRAWLLRTFALPRIFASRRFPQNAPAPREVRPDPEAAAALTPDDAMARLEATAEAARRVLRSAGPAAGMVHAYFGRLSPLQTLRLLSAHTRHHTLGMRARSAA